MAEPVTVRVNQRQLALHLRVDAKRMDWAQQEGIIHRIDGAMEYDLHSAVGEWLEYERRKRETSKRRSALEREKAALTKARRELVQLRLSTLRGEMVNVNDTAGALKASCLRIRSRLQAALPRIARGCYYAQGLDEATRKVRSEFDLLMAELSALDKEVLMSETPFEVVRNDNGEDGTSSTEV